MQRRNLVLVACAMAGVVVACSATPGEDEKSGESSAALAADAACTDAADAHPADANDASEETCREVTLSVRRTQGRGVPQIQRPHDEANLASPMRFEVPYEIELADGSAHKAYDLTLTFDAVTCTYAHAASDSDLVARLVSCADGSRAGAVVRASHWALDLEPGSPVSATLDLEEEHPCGSDAGADAGRRDAASEAGSDAGADAGASDAAGVDAGADAGLDAGFDAGPPCTTASCNDGNACTVDTCTAQGCTHAPSPAGASCSDHNPCNGTEACDGTGACLPGVPPNLDDGNPCTVDACDPVLGVTHTPATAGTSCSDGNLCNGFEICNASGTCQPGTPPVVDDGNACTVDACDPFLGVTHTPSATGTSCSDGNVCNGLELCNGAGSCAPGTPLVVDDGNPCTVDSCDPLLGVLHTPAGVGTSCSDGNVCNGSETCDGAGSCAPGTPLVIDDGNPCTGDSCDPLLGVQPTPAPAGTACSDGNLCNGLETCNATGVCQAGTPISVNDNNICTIDSCDPVAGVVHTPVPNCNPTPVQGDAPFETRASLLGTLVSSTGAAVTNASFTIYDEHVSATPRTDVLPQTAPDGSFRLKLTTFPDAEPDRSPPHRLVVLIDSPNTLRAFRVAYAHVGDSVELGTIRLVQRDPLITSIGSAGGTASDSQGLVQVVIPPGALTTTLPIQITPFLTRDDFPASLPDSSQTGYGFSLEPNGTTFALPVTVRAANYRNFPPTLNLPAGFYDEVENRWEHMGIASWDGTRFSATTTHFTFIDFNPNKTGDLVALITNGGNGNKSGAVCGTGSSWRAGGGSVDQVFPLPATHARGDDFGVTLQYDSGLAGTRRLGSAPSGGTPGSSTATPLAVVPRGTLAVSIPGTSVRLQCVPRGAGGASSLKPGECVTSVGGCSAGGVSLGSTIALLAAERRSVLQTAQNAKEADFAGWVDVPMADGGQVASSGFTTQKVVFGSSALSACVGSGGVFGVSDPLAPRVQLTEPDGAWATMQRKVLVHHRFSSPFGAGWAVREVSRLFVTGDQAVLVDGDGQEEEFRPRARVSPLPDKLGEHAFARDPSTGELFVASQPGVVSRIDPITGGRTPVVSGLGLPGSDFVHDLAVTYVGATRHFVVATTTELLDVDAAGTQRVLAPRPVVTLSNIVSNQSSVAAQGDKVYYTTGSDTPPVLYRVNLSAAAPALEQLSAATNGDKRLFPTSQLSVVQFDGPRGLLAAPDGSLYVAEPRRNVVYRIAPEAATGVVGPTSLLTVAVGDGAGRHMAAPGERQPALAFSMNQPLRLSMGDDGLILVQLHYGIALFDPLAKEAELLFLDNGRDEVVPSLSGESGPISAFPASIVALNATSLFSRTSADGLVRVDIDRLSSERDPTRTVAVVAGGGFELTDTTRAQVWRFDTAGRLVEQRKRTGETDFSVAYADAKSDRIDHITNAVGGQWAFSYSNDKLAAITDPSGGTTTAQVTAQGDLVGFTEPDGEAHTFAYDQHHMTSKTSPRGDVTTYTYGPDGTIATSTKPGGESYSFSASLAQTAGYDATGHLQRQGSYVDARGVTHAFQTNALGTIESDTYTADGVAYTSRLVYAATPLLGPAEDFSARRNNTLLRVAYRTLNGVSLSPQQMVFDSMGRPATLSRQISGAADINNIWSYSPDGWLLQEYDGGPSGVATRFERDSVGHVLRMLDVGRESLTSLPTGRQTTFTWRADGQPATITTHGVTTTLSYDDAGSHNLLSTVDTLGRAVALGYDARGNVISVTDGTASSAFTYDANNRLVESRDGFGNPTSLRYVRSDCGCSEEDQVTGVHTPDLPAGVEWTMAYGPQGRLASVTDPQGFTESYTYEPTGELAGVTDRLARTTTMSHDQLGRVLSIVDTLGRTHQRSYAVPQAGAWGGPSLTSASGDATQATSSLSTPLRSGDYQIGLNAFDTEGSPARISLYRDATFALAYRHDYNLSGRLTFRGDRSTLPIDSATITHNDPSPLAQEQYLYDTSSSTPLLSTLQSGNDVLSITRNLEHDITVATGLGTGLEGPATYGYTRDAGGRVVAQTTRFAALTAFDSYGAHYGYYPDGRLASATNADGAVVTVDFGAGSVAVSEGRHDFTYDVRGQVATLQDFDGVYAYSYDLLGRNTRLVFPDGHTRVQVYDDLGRITSRCYEYADATLNRCYGAQYDAVGNPVRLSDPEGTDVVTYDALDRLTKVTREVGGVAVSVEDYAYNALGALAVNAGVALDTQRPRLDGAGTADAAVPASLGGQPVSLDAAGRIASFGGASLTWSPSGQLRSVASGIPAVPETFGTDAYMRRVWTVGGGSEFYLHDGANRIATVAPAAVIPPGHVAASYLYDGVDHPLRIAGSDIVALRNPNIPAAFIQHAVMRAYYEVDLAGNVRRLRGRGGDDLGGYRYSAFGQTLENTVVNPLSVLIEDLRAQPLRWKGRPIDAIGGVEVYDMRARWWVPALGAFLSVDEYAFHDPVSTLWGWPRQNPMKYRDPFGRSWSLDPNQWDDSTQQYFLSGQAERDTAAFFVSAELGIATAGLANEVQLAGFGVRGAIAAGAFGGGIAAAESDLIRSGGKCVSASNVAMGVALGSLAAWGSAMPNAAPPRTRAGGLSRAGQALDRGGLTRAGRALQKHGGREGSVFSAPTGNPEAINRQGQAALEDILGNVSETEPNKFGGLDYYGGSTGGGARFDAAGNFIGFLEP